METVKVYESVTRYKADIFLHQVNCQGVMGSGVAKHVKKDYPKVFSEYHKLCVNTADRRELLGMAQFIKCEENKWAGNLFSQYDFAKSFTGLRKVQFTEEKALEKSMNITAEFCLAQNCKTVAIPFKMGSVRGGGDWNIVLSIVQKSLILAHVETLVICEFA